MLSQHALKEILELTRESGGSFVILEKDEPRLVISDFNFYEELVNRAQNLSKTALPNTSAENTVPARNHYFITGGKGALGARLVKDLSEQGHQITDADTLSVDLLDEGALNEVFDKNNFDAVIHLAGSYGRRNSLDSPELYFVNNVEGGINLLKMMAKYGVGKMVYQSTSLSGTPCDAAKMVYEQILSFYHKAFNISSVSLRIPFLASINEADNNSADKIYDSPLEAIIYTAGGVISCLPVPSFTDDPDGAANIEILSTDDAAQSIIFALNLLQTSSGSMIYKVDGLSLNLNSLIQEVMEVTGKMIPTTLSPDINISDSPTDGTATLTSIGWPGPSKKLRDIILELWDSFRSTAPDTSSDYAQHERNEPISLSDLLSGKYTPFIKPHNS